MLSPLTHLVNLSIRENKFPNNWKKAIVTPVFKTGDCDLGSNYRPISILPVLSKVLEKVVASQVIEHLETNQLLHPQQFGFRPKHSTETANIFFIESIKQSLDSGNVVGAVFLDLKKAFDTVNHNILLSKLKSFKFSKEAVDWFESYLQNGEQCVKINQEKSSFLNNRMGIPQGSILGPLLFSLFINDLPKTCPEAGFQLHADDAVIYAPAKSPSKAAETLTQHLYEVQQWLEHSHLILNLNKTVSMCLSIRKPSLHESLHVKIKNEEIQEVNEFKFLGIVLDPQLKFDKHIKKITKTVKSNLNCFRLIRHYIPTQAAQIFMHSMIFFLMLHIV